MKYLIIYEQNSYFADDLTKLYEIIQINNLDKDKCIFYQLKPVNVEGNVVTYKTNK